LSLFPVGKTDHSKVTDRTVEYERTGDISTFLCSQDQATFSSTFLIWSLCPSKLAVFPKKAQILPLVKTHFLTRYFQNALMQRPKKIFTWNLCQMSPPILNFYVKKKADRYQKPFLSIKFLKVAWYRENFFEFLRDDSPDIPCVERRRSHMDSSLVTK